MYLNRDSCLAGDAVLLYVVEWPPNGFTANGMPTLKHLCECNECGGIIIDILFRCTQCEDYNMCGLCVTTGKHLEHLVIRTTGYKVLYICLKLLLNSIII